MARREDDFPEEDFSLGDLMATGRVVAKADRDQDVFAYIDELRQHRENDKQRMRVMWSHIRAQRLALHELKQQTQWTETGIWDSVAKKLNAKTVRGLVWVIGAIFVAALGLVGAVWRLHK